ncbi:DUF192 domain-containing protein [Tranquillimonas alkanivorans]|uniref:DUF192 domain-containing protein n=1 Tax=Tranquillimonas alkanivorans TaxID=441119 RepID=A0A1I5MIR4_9RHOB|nr:DUF192 domain-containing protein [Tranquillimonas alkanivorans]SFP09472.1 hypothetical protein SAMN04488047_102290 [Tranquillimonas alkanivorans]
MGIGFARGLSVCALAAWPGALWAACSETAVELRGDWGQARFNVELADEPQERAQGLMHRDNLPRSAGMLFVYDAPQRARFWMKNTLIPLDMIFVDDTGTVTRVHENAVPHDLTGIDGGEGVLAVLEINGGMAGAMGIVPGTEMRHPAFGDAAAWPCGQ